MPAPPTDRRCPAAPSKPASAPATRNGPLAPSVNSYALPHRLHYAYPPIAPTREQRASLPPAAGPVASGHFDRAAAWNIAFTAYS